MQAHIEQGLAELAAQDLQDEPPAASAEQLQRHIATLAQELQRCEQALAVVRERDTAKQAKEGAQAPAVRVPVTDPDAYVLPNKEGGYAPNYTPVAGVDSRNGMILAADVLADGSEASALLPLVETVKEAHGTEPGRVLCDSGFASGSNQAALAEAGIAVYTPVATAAPEQHPARRDDPAQPLSVGGAQGQPGGGGEDDDGDDLAPLIVAEGSSTATPFSTMPQAMFITAPWVRLCVPVEPPPI